MPKEFAVSLGLNEALGIEESPMDEVSPMTMLEKIMGKLEGMEIALGIKEDLDDDPDFDSDDGDVMPESF
jgi:hypothetical protein